MSHTRTRYSKEVDRVLLRIVHTGDPRVINVPPPTNNDSYPILREEVEAAVKSPKQGVGRSGQHSVRAGPGRRRGHDRYVTHLADRRVASNLDSLPDHHSPEERQPTSVDMLLVIWRTGEWPTTWTHSLVITLPKKGNLQLCHDRYVARHLADRRVANNLDSLPGHHSPEERQHTIMSKVPSA